MKLTKEQEAEVIPIYHEWWHSYLNGDVKTYEHYLDDDYRFVGSTVAEDFLNKRDTTQFFDETADQLSGKIEKRNSKLTVEYYDGIVFITELTDAYLLFGDEWTFYGKFRLSSMLRKTSVGWRFIYQHFSVPDSKAQEGETIGFEQVSKENQELRDAIKRRTAELENKNRELEIESALERIRLASMAMHSSEELASVARTVFEQLRVLGIDVYRSWIDIFHVTEGYVLTWSTDFEGNFQPNPATFPLDFDETMSDFYRDYKSSSKFIELEAHGDEVREWFDYLYSVSSDPIFRMTSVPNDMYQIWAKHKYGTVATTKLSPITNDEKDILNRFANVFEQAYTRFLDLQKAEAQAREAQIEAALERVRSRSLAMQHSSELSFVVDTLLSEFTNLEFSLTFCIINLINEQDMSNTVWAANPETGKDAESYYMKFEDYPFHHAMWDAWKAQKKRFIYTMEGEEKRVYDEYLFTDTEWRRFPKHVQDANKALKRYVAGFTFFKYSGLQTVSVDPITEDDLEILERFGRVFEQTYTRFLDLQKAEAQAQEARIEAALERVRSRTMGMQKAEELGEVATVLFDEMNTLVDNLWTCGFVLCEKNRKEDEWWLSLTNGLIKPFSLPNVGDYAHETLYEGWKKGEAYRTVTLENEQLQEHYDWLMSIPIAQQIFEDMEGSGISRPNWQRLHAAYFKTGYLVIITEIPCEEEEIFKRFAQVFDQTYTRFLDLQKAEAQAKEAQIELSLERIRSQVTAMQESSDLLDIVVTMRTEFVKLGHEAHYFWHMRWLPESYAKAMTSGEGTKIGMVMTLPRHIHGEIPLIADWEKTKEPTLVLAMDVETAVDYVEKMITLGDFEQVDPQAPTLDDIRHIGGLTFVMARTTHGEIGYSLPGVVTNPPKNAVDTLVRFASVFDLAYKRFEDLKAAERQALLIREERDRLEIALKELHATQDQLVQQEKLASLGQLTAGIAHEIKNPLNFVNNFSEVSIEMIDEIREELAKMTEDGGQKTDISEILNDIEANLRKIHEHGSRADGIVKSMLQHSRGGDGKMEPSPLNPLIKEYVNLAFHGMRAGKNPINVDIQMDLDDSIGEIPMIAEDFSRVILNLCNNAFDAMREKLIQNAKFRIQNFTPKLSIRTKSENNNITIEIEDNGSGIPDDIKDKILQPFFTTKKGTQGTGLGLSITHDIVKAHGGELTIETIINKGTNFIIKLST